MHIIFTLLLLFLAPLVAQESIDKRLEESIKFSENSNRIGKILIDDRSGSISQSTWIYVKNALDYYKKNPPLFIILELNTPGGEVFAAQKISDGLKEMDTQYGVPVVAVINNWAISAGAMLAYSARFIAVVKDASMGAAEPVIQDASGEMKTASEKINSALRSDFANRASFFDRNPAIAEAMVDKDLILVIRDGKIIKLDSEKEIINDPQADIVISPKGKLLTLNTKQLLEYGVADIYLPPLKHVLITPQEKTSGKWPADKEILFEDPFFKKIPHAEIDQFQMDWKTEFLSYLANPYVNSLLLLGLMLGLYMEFQTGGLGIAATVSLTCLVLLLMSSFALEIADWFELILICIGLAIILVDLFVLPTFGLLGFIGILIFLSGLFGLLLPGLNSAQYDFDSNTFNAAGEAVLDRLGLLMGTFLLGLVIMFFLPRYFSQSKLFKKFILRGNEQTGYSAVPDLKTIVKVGKRGIVISNLRPAGKIEVDGQLYDAMSSGRLIEKGAHVIIIRSEGPDLIVEEEKK